MPRATVMLREGGWEAQARRLARALSPVALSPAAPRETVAAVPERHCRKLWVASLQSTGLLLRDGAAGGVVHDVGRWLQHRYPDQPGVRPMAGGAVHAAGLLYRASRRLPSRGRTGDRPQLSEPTAVPETLATSYVVTTVGMGLARGFVWSRVPRWPTASGAAACPIPCAGSHWGPSSRRGWTR